MHTKFAVFIFITSLLSLSISGCGNAEDSALADRYQVNLDLNKGGYDTVIRSLGDCSQFTGGDKERCLLNLGVAYMARGGFDLLSIGQDVLELDQNRTSNKQFSEDLTKLLVEKMNHESVIRGVEVIIQLLNTADPALKSRLCTESRYQNYGRYVSQGCLASNPLLLSDILREEAAETTAQKSSTVAVSLQDIINYKDTIQDAAPEVNIDEVTDIINKKDPAISKDKNGNKVTDSLDATSCAIDAYKSGSFKASGCTNNTSGTQIAQLSEDAFHGSGKSALNHIFSVVTTVSNGANLAGGSVFYRLLQQSVASTRIFTLSTQGFCRADGVTSCSESELDGKTCLPCPIITENATRTQTLEDSVDTILNDEQSFKALAATLESGEDKKTDKEKETDLRKKICGDNLEKCPEKNPDGSVRIPTDVALDYLKDKE